MPAASIPTLASLIAGFAAVFPAIHAHWTASPVALAIATVAIALIDLFRPGNVTKLLTAACAGALTAIAGLAIQQAGFERQLSYLLALSFPLSSAVLARRPQFDPSGIRQEALLFLSALGLILAVATPIASGYSAAQSLNSAAVATAVSIPAWVGWTIAASLTLGGAASVWRHR